jgi:hypothetical protein
MRLRLNTAIYSWDDCLFMIDNQRITPAGNPWNIVALDYEQKRERKVVYTNRRSGRPRGKTRGKYSVPSCSLKLLVAQAVELEQYLQQQGVGSFGDAEFILTIQISTPGIIGAVPITIIAEGCTIDDEKQSHEEGIDEIVTELEIGVLTISRNGLKLWSTIDTGQTA